MKGKRGDKFEIVYLIQQKGVSTGGFGSTPDTESERTIRLSLVENAEEVRVLHEIKIDYRKELRNRDSATKSLRIKFVDEINTENHVDLFFGDSENGHKILKVWKQSSIA